MSEQLAKILPYALAAAGAGALGGVAALFWEPNVRIRSAVQHLAAGAVLAAVCLSVMPEAERTGSIGGVLAGFAAGGLAMVGLKWLVLRLEARAKARHALPIGLATAAGLDTLLDGVIISAGFTAASQVGALLVAALALELFFLTLSVGSEFRKGKTSKWIGLAVTTGIAALLLIGAVVSAWLLVGAPTSTIAVVLAFGAAALIYLIAEELLVESIQAEKSLFSTTTLFLGFLVILAIELYTS